MLTPLHLNRHREVFGSMKALEWNALLIFLKTRDKVQSRTTLQTIPVMNKSFLCLKILPPKLGSYHAETSWDCLQFDFLVVYSFANVNYSCAWSVRMGVLWLYVCKGLYQSTLKQIWNQYNVNESFLPVPNNSHKLVASRNEMIFIDTNL